MLSSLLNCYGMLCYNNVRPQNVSSETCACTRMKFRRAGNTMAFSCTSTPWQTGYEHSVLKAGTNSIAVCLMYERIWKAICCPWYFWLNMGISWAAVIWSQSTAGSSSSHSDTYVCYDDLCDFNHFTTANGQKGRLTTHHTRSIVK